MSFSGRGRSCRPMLSGTSVRFISLHHVGNVKSAFTFNNGALGMLLALAGVSFDHAGAFNDDPALFRRDADNSPALAFIGAGNDDDVVAFLHMHYSPIGSGFFDMRLDDIADMSIALVAAQDADGRGALGAGIISHIQNGTNL